MHQLAHLGVHLLEVLFFTGLVGSLGVVLFSVVEDVREFLRSDEHA